MDHPPRRPQIVSVALPASLTLDIPHLREKTARLGFVSRALATFRVEEAIIYRDRGGAEIDREARLVEKMLTFLFSQGIIVAYLLFVTVHATWEHCNFGPSFQWLEPYLIFPRFHHWHHTSQTEAIDKNFAIHFPWVDKIFGTYYYPDDKWPEHYGLHDETIPGTFWAQTLYPFTAGRRSAR